MTPGPPLHFEERQFLGSNPATWIGIPFAILSWGLAFTQLVLSIPVGDKPVSDAGMVLFWVVGGLLPLALMLLNLHIRVTAEALDIRYVPFKRQTIAVDQIRFVERRRRDLLSEFGGWGARRSRRHGMSYTVDGAEGVQLELRNGQTVFIGSRRAQELERALEQLRR